MEVQLPAFRLYTTVWSKRELSLSHECGLPVEFLHSRRVGSCGIIKEHFVRSGIGYWLVLHGDGGVAIYSSDEIEYRRDEHNTRQLLYLAAGVLFFLSSIIFFASGFFA